MPKKATFIVDDAGKRIYSCLFCSKTFPYRTSLKRHKNICKKKPQKIQSSEKISDNPLIQVPNIIVEDQKKPEISERSIQTEQIQEKTLDGLYDLIYSLKDNISRIVQQNKQFAEICGKNSVLTSDPLLATPLKSPSKCSKFVEANPQKLCNITEPNTIAKSCSNFSANCMFFLNI